MISLVAMGTEMDEDVPWFTGCLASACESVSVCVCVALGECLSLPISL